jgi:flagella synthesis protein FlgN
VICSSSPTDAAAPINSAADVARALAEETGGIEALIALLREEQQALQARDMERVYSFAVAKRERLARLSGFESARAKFLLANRLSQDQAGMRDYIERTPGLREAVAENWRRLLANAAEARQINAVNGMLIAAQLRFVAGALAALRQATSHLVCYGADGQTRSTPGSRTFASA